MEQKLRNGVNKPRVHAHIREDNYEYLKYVVGWDRADEFIDQAITEKRMRDGESQYANKKKQY